MFDRLGLVGVAGVLVTLVGLAVVAWQSSLVLAAGFAMVIGGLGLVVYGLVSNLLAAFGLGGGGMGGMGGMP